jgi:hypothetical protein
MSKEMSVKKDLKCVFNMPEKIKSEFDSEEEMAHSLPPYEPMDAYPVDEYEACPTNWMNGSDVASSYFVGVEEDKGMWLDFNECFYHTHDVAVVISIQGINPITGQKMVAEKALQLEQYHKKCPIHGTKFKQDRFCKKCGFKWPGQNYLATTGTPELKMWLDGFRSSDGKVRQYIITEDKVRGVAAQMIGEDRVFAIGIAYYLSKHKKPYTLQRPEVVEGFHSHYKGPAYCGSGIAKPMFFSPCHNPGNWNIGSHGSPTAYGGSCSAKGKGTGTDAKGVLRSNTSDKISCSIDDSAPRASAQVQLQSMANDPDQTIITHHAFDHGIVLGESAQDIQQSVQPVTPVKQLEIGAGALIQQRVYDDPKMMDYWEKEPAGMIYINYCDKETQKKIIDAGRRADEKDGFLKDVKIGG